MNTKITSQASDSSFYSSISSISVEDLYLQFETSNQGLDESRIDFLLSKYGNNILEDKVNCPALHHLWNAVMNPLNVMLSLLAIVMFYSDDEGGSVIVLSMVVLSSLLTFVQEYRSSNAVKKLQQMIDSTVTVSRIAADSGPVISIDDRENGKSLIKKIPTRNLVPGDLIVLKSGDTIPADLRLLEAGFLYVNESSMTGESLSVEKTSDQRLLSEGGSLFDHSNLLFQGTNIVSGWAKAIVVRTGRATVFGKLKKSLVSEKPRSPFDKGLHNYVIMMLGFMCGLMVLTLLANFLLSKSTTWTDAIQFSLAVAVGLTPEMLPMIVTVNLAKGAIEMSMFQVIVKRLTAIQNIGAMEVLCIDKTGTLTEDHVALEAGLDHNFSNASYPIELAYYVSRFQEGSNNFLDTAITSHVDQNNQKYVQKCQDFVKINEIPFDFHRKCVSVVLKHANTQQSYLIAKGSIEEIIQKSEQFVSSRFSTTSDDQILGISDLIEPLTSLKKQTLLSKVTKLNKSGYRVLGVAYKPVFSHECSESQLVFVGFLSFHDPPKSSSATCIERLRNYGLEIKVLTGDNPHVAQYICQKVGLEAEDDHIITGSELLRLAEPDFDTEASRRGLFAKLTPEQKEQIVRSLQKQGKIVGFLGDGINDSLALKAADCGISVDNAADIAKQCADIILLEKNLDVLAQGVEMGRKTFGNIVKYLKMSSSSNFGSVFSIAGASFILSFLPMTAVQLLLQTLLYEVSQCGIPFDTVDIEYMTVPRRWDIGNIARFMIMIGPISSIFDYGTWAVMWYFFENHGETASEITQFQTAWFIEGLMTQTLIVHIIRTHKVPFFESRASGVLFATTGIILVMAVVLPYSPIKDYVPFIAPEAEYYPFLVVFLISYCVLAHYGKMGFYSLYGLK